MSNNKHLSSIVVRNAKHLVGILDGRLGEENKVLRTSNEL